MEKSLFLVGGTTWINLINTIQQKNKVKTDILGDPVLTVAWLEANELLRESDTIFWQTPYELERIIQKLPLLRLLCQKVLAEVRHAGHLSRKSMRSLQDIVAKLKIDIRLSNKTDKLSFVLEGQTPYDHIQYHVIHSLIETITHVSPQRIRKCGHEDCILTFVDTSKSGKRRWCSMERCGNRHKAAEFYARKKRS